MRIVLIDDDQLVCMSLKMILEADSDITVAAIGNDGAEALPLYKEHNPDVLLMDIRMKRALPIIAIPAAGAKKGMECLFWKILSICLRISMSKRGRLLSPARGMIAIFTGGA